MKQQEMMNYFYQSYQKVTMGRTRFYMATNETRNVFPVQLIPRFDGCIGQYVFLGWDDSVQAICIWNIYDGKLLKAFSPWGDEIERGYNLCGTNYWPAVIKNHVPGFWTRVWDWVRHLKIRSKK